jgi:hypothetical protein
MSSLSTRAGGQALVILDACLAFNIPVAGRLAADENARNTGANLKQLGDLSMLDSADLFALTTSSLARRTVSFAAPFPECAFRAAPRNVPNAARWLWKLH